MYICMYVLYIHMYVYIYIHVFVGHTQCVYIIYIEILYEYIKKYTVIQ